MGKSKGQQKRAREEGVAPSVDTMLTAILSVEGESPTAKLIQASELWSAEPAPTEAFFSKVRPYVESLTSSKGVAEDDAEDELMELFEEYEAKSADALLGELDELKSAGVLSKKEAKALKGMSAEEQRRLLFVRILVIAMETDDADDEAGEEAGEEAGDEITEESIEKLTEADCAEKPEQKETEAVHDLMGWVCGLPTAELREMCEARGLDIEHVPADARLGLVQALLRGMLEAEAALEEESDDEDDDIDDEEEEEEEEDDDIESDEEDEEDDEEDEDEDEGAPAKKAKTGSAAGSDEKPGDCKQQ